MTRVLRSGVVLASCAFAVVALVALWAFVSYLQPSFSGELVSEVLRCN